MISALILPKPGRKNSGKIDLIYPECGIVVEKERMKYVEESFPDHVIVVFV